MLLFRLILIVVVGFLVYRIYRLMGERRLAAQQRRIKGEDMVQCAYCDTHVPRASAVEQDGHWYCSKEHRDRHNID